MAESLAGLLDVVEVRRLTPRMTRVTFTGDGLRDFPTWPDQQLKLCFPRPGQSKPTLPAEDAADVMRWYQAFTAIPEEERPWMRSFTVRGSDPAAGTIDVDFVLHGDSGPASLWAMSAKPGDTLGRYGPSAIYARPLGKADRYLFAADETGLPAIGTLLESLPAGAHADVFIEVADEREEQKLDAEVHWLHRGDVPAGRSTLLADAVRAADLPEIAWLAGEAGIVRTLRRDLVARGVDKKSIEFAGYWRLKLTQDDAPTPEDLAEAQERMAG
ncbi:NADPH-dependent ferric siderophore reductase, contains FAD-binding and SIP domains [Amycolatopsis xylanica]|uniref:NADPH-dependent ferric siderophore reductase, contains FAD-binding and SIP domains n=1 Tax=Amycolatopsis xylanica TaxID=589385 RepID=A0A1H3D9W8_9PSEU|nr:siderophore-interacting protein [Amycolatopsis xylanica]SDX63191.1 NADPH-dependent ferric siderophore reductase, contains FAD-binding and SIP domains [Amycolatopsis xylanica]